MNIPRRFLWRTGKFWASWRKVIWSEAHEHMTLHASSVQVSRWTKHKASQSNWANLSCGQQMLRNNGLLSTIRQHFTVRFQMYKNEENGLAFVLLWCETGQTQRMKVKELIIKKAWVMYYFCELGNNKSATRASKPTKIHVQMSD